MKLDEDSTREGVYSKRLQVRQSEVNLRCGLGCGVRLKRGTTGREGEMSNRDRVKVEWRLAQRSATRR